MRHCFYTTLFTSGARLQTLMLLFHHNVPAFPCMLSIAGGHKSGQSEVGRRSPPQLGRSHAAAVAAACPAPCMRAAPRSAVSDCMQSHLSSGTGCERAQEEGPPSTGVAERLGLAAA